jgi:hypothetical protein
MRGQAGICFSVTNYCLHIWQKKGLISAAKHGRPMASVKALMVSGKRKTLKSIVEKLVANAEC